MDLITDVFPSLRVAQAVYTRVEASSPWGFDFIPYHHTKYGVVIEGECYIDLKNGESPVNLKQGDCYLLPRGDAFRLRDKNLSETVDFEDALKSLEGRELRYGGGGSVTTIIGGRFILADNQYPVVLDLLPSLVHFSVNKQELKALQATIEMLASEAVEPTMGSKVMVNRLADIFFIQSLRAYLMTDKQHSVGWLGSVVDEKLGVSIRLMHQNCSKRWTLASLAEKAGMSRAVFAARFKEKLGTSPMLYLTRYRLTKAQQLLQHSSMSISQIASTVGYESEAAFNKAFKRELGVPPGEFRKAGTVVLA